MKIILFVLLAITAFVISPAFAEEQLELLISPLIAKILVPGAPYDAFIIRDVKNSLTWDMASIPIDGLDYVEGNTYHIIAKKSDDFTFPLNKKYDLIEIKQVFKSHKPYSLKNLCLPGYHVWTDGNCVFAFRCSEYAYPGKPCKFSFHEQDYLRPLQQQKVGILPEDIICLESLQLVISQDNTPACVKHSSVDKLLERGFLLGKNNNDSPYN